MKKVICILAILQMVTLMSMGQISYSITDSVDEYQGYYDKAVSGDVESQFLMGEIYKNGYCGQSVDGNEAIRWFKKAAAHNHLGAIAEIIDCYDKGKVIPQDYNEVFIWTNKLVEVDETFICQLGELYFEGKGTEKNLAEAVRIYSKVEPKCNSYFLLGNCYMEGGYGIEQDYKKAEDYFNKSISDPSSSGEPFSAAYLSLAILYAKGYKQFDKAYKYIERAEKAEPGEKVSVNLFKGRVAYYEGNIVKANDFLSLARENAEKERNRGIIYGEEVFRDLEELLTKDLVDSDIIVNPQTKENTFAVVIGNENYQRVAMVEYALNDARIFTEYCKKTLGIPDQNVRVYEDATYGSFISAISDIKNIAQAYEGDLQVIFYYAGHGVPNEKTKEAYLLPVDADGMHIEACYPLSKLFQELGGMGAKNVVVLLDACFSGSKRGEGMLATARGVAIKSKSDTPQDNMVVVSAAQGDETAFPYHKKKHGMFTYFLLKKLRETKGQCTLGELATYIQKNVKQQAVVINRKPQTPTVLPSQTMKNDWRTIKLR